MITEHQSQKLNNDAVRLAFSDLSDGNMSFSKPNTAEGLSNIEAFLDSQLKTRQASFAIRSDYTRSSYADIIVVDELHTDSTDSLQLVTADALITSLPKTVLALPVADCAALTIYEPEQKIIALAHLGRHGCEDDLPKKLVQKLIDDFNAKPELMICHISPALDANTYATDKHYLADDPKWQEHIKQVDGNTHIDIKGYIADQLQRSGVLPNNIETSPISTALSPHYGSHYVHTHKPGIDKSRDRFLVAAMMN